MQCFDSMWQEEVINDLYESKFQDDKLALLYEINKTNIVKIKTAKGFSDAKVVKNIVCQGDPWGRIA